MQVEYTGIITLVITYLVTYDGYLGDNGVTSNINSIRPAIALKSTTRVTGFGTSANPYKVVS